MGDKLGGKTDAEKEINFSALKKHDDGIQYIIDTASSVAHYKFNSAGVWEKTDVEGSLFLYSRKTAPYIIIFIMNRLNQDNAKLTLTPEMEFKVQEPFLLCKASNSEIIGIWFYDSAECRRFGALLNRFHALSHDERSLQISIMMEAQKRESSSKSGSPGVSNGIMGMFSQAQDEYTKSRLKFAQEHNKSQKNSNQQKKDSSKPKKIPFHRGISEPNLKSNPVTRTIEHIEPQTPNPPSSREEQMRQQRQRMQDEAHREEDILYNLIHGTNKPRNRTTSSNIELGDGGRTNIGNLSSAAGDLASFNEFSEHLINNHHVKQKAIDCAELESQLCKPIRQSRSENTFDSSPPQWLNAHGASTTHNGFQETREESYVAQLEAIAISNEESKTKNKAMSTLQSTNSNSNSMFSSSALQNGSGNLVQQQTPTSVSTSLTNHLLSPHVMLSGKGRGTTLTALAGGQQNFSLAANFNKQAKITKKVSDPTTKTELKGAFPEAPSGAALKSLMSPAAFASVAKTTDKGVSKPTTKISKQDFRNIMIEMMQTDDEFVTKLHNTFLERLSSQS